MIASHDPGPADHADHPKQQRLSARRADWFTSDVYRQPDDSRFNAILFGATKQELLTLTALWRARIVRIGMATGVIAALAVFACSLSGVAAIDPQLEADADRGARHYRTTVHVALEHDACQFMRSVALRRSVPDA